MVTILENTTNFNSSGLYFLSGLFIILKLQPFCRRSVFCVIILLLICDFHTSYDVTVLFTLHFYLHISCFHLEYSQISLTFKTTCAVPTVKCIRLILDRFI
jgi:hypothetical protein